MNSVNWTLNPYYKVGSTESRSIVLRSDPADFFRKYSDALGQFGTWNPSLVHPTDPNGRLPGWIFPSKKETEVRKLIESIINGSIEPTTLQSAQPGSSQIIPIMTTSQEVISRVQTITLIRPIVGDTLYLSVNGIRYPIEVKSITKIQDEIITEAIVSLGTNNFTIRLSDFKWQLVDYKVTHKIEL